jgi:hypothetical protein
VISFIVSGEFAEAIITFLRDKYSKIHSMKWRFPDTVLSLFIHEEFVMRTTSHQTITTIVESNRGNGDCRITVIASGGKGTWTSWGSESAGENTVRKRIEKLIGVKALIDEGSVVRLECPHCKAVYGYRIYSAYEGGYKECQNCGRQVEIPGS